MMMNGKRKVIIFSVLILMVTVIAGVGYYYWYQNKNYVSTEDSRLAGDILRVSPQITGKLLEFNIEEGQTVQKGQVLGRQEMTNLPDSSMELATIRSPVSGIVLKKQGNVGEVVTPGQVLAMIVNPEKIYVTANIEETKLERVKKGQIVEINIDQYPDKGFLGKVDTIGQATAATFSLLPTSTGGNFTKVVQKVPVKIQIDKTDVKLLPGTNAVVKIHLY
jgi:multidrug resistance efflux pump